MDAGRGEPDGDDLGSDSRPVGPSGAEQGLRKIRCVVADPRPIERGAIVRALNLVDLFYVAGEAADVGETLRMLRVHLPELVIVGHSPPALSGEAIIERALAARPQTKLLLLVDQTDIVAARKLLRVGAAGCLPLSATSSDLIVGALVAAVIEVPPPWDALFPSGSRRRGREHLEPTRELSSREAEILQLLADGMSPKQIAHRLSISTATVRTHLARTYEKLGASSAVGAVAEALRAGVVT